MTCLTQTLGIKTLDLIETFAISIRLALEPAWLFLLFASLGIMHLYCLGG